MSKKDSNSSFSIGSITYRYKQRKSGELYSGSVFYYPPDEKRAKKVSDLPLLISESLIDHKAREIAEIHHRKHFSDDSASKDQTTLRSLLSFEDYWNYHKELICDINAWSRTDCSTYSKYQLAAKNGFAQRFGEKPISGITTEECNRVLNEIVDNAESAETDRLYGWYRNILYKIFKYAVARGHCKANPVLALEDYPEESITAITKTLIRERLSTKTIPLDKVRKIYQYTKQEHIHSGELLGLAIMLFTGMRTGEVSGLRFSEFVEMKDYPGEYILRVVESRENKTTTTNRLKTPNAYRKLPVISILADIILEKLNFLHGKMPSGTDVSQLFIVCSGEVYDKPCLETQLSTFIHEILIASEVKNRMLIVPPIVEDDKEALEPSPESYLLRRHAISYAYSLANLDEKSAAYFAGHSLKGKDLNTLHPYRDYGNEDKLHAVLVKMERISFWITGIRKEKTAQLDMQVRSAHFEAVDFQKIVITLEPGESASLNLYACRANDPIKISIKTEMPARLVEASSASPPISSDTGNITGSYRDYVVPITVQEDDVNEEENNITPFVNSPPTAGTNKNCKKRGSQYIGPNTNPPEGQLINTPGWQDPPVLHTENEVDLKEDEPDRSSIRHIQSVIKGFKKFLEFPFVDPFLLGQEIPFSEALSKENGTMRQTFATNTCGSEDGTSNTRERRIDSTEEYSSVNKKTPTEATIAPNTTEEESRNCKENNCDIAEKLYLCIFTWKGFAKRIPISEINCQNKATTGRRAITCRDGDYVKFALLATKEESLLLIGSAGNAYIIAAEKLPELGFDAKGSHIREIISLSVESEVFTAGLNLTYVKHTQSTLTDCTRYIAIITKSGLIKRLDTQLIIGKRNNLSVTKAITLGCDDEVVSVLETSGDAHLLLSASDGMILCISENEIMPTGKLAKGRIGIGLHKGAHCSAAALVIKGVPMLSLTKNGLGKRTLADEYYTGQDEKLPARCGGKGLIGYDINDVTGLFAAITSAPDDQDLFLINRNGILLRISCASLSILSRQAHGYCVMKTTEDVASCVLFRRPSNK